MRTAAIVMMSSVLAAGACDLEDRSLGAAPGEDGDENASGGDEGAPSSLLEGDGVPGGERHQ